jgi:hypothetical protein
VEESTGEGDKSEVEEEGEYTTPRGSGSEPQQPLDENQYVVACGEWLLHCFQKARPLDDLGGRIFLSQIPHWREGPAGAAEIAVSSALLSTSDPVSRFTTWQDRFPFLSGTFVGPVSTPVTGTHPIPSVSMGTNKLGQKAEIERNTINPADWNSAIGSLLPIGVLGAPRTRTSGSSDFTIKFCHQGCDVFLFVAVTLEKLTKLKVKTVIIVSPRANVDVDA